MSQVRSRGRDDVEDDVPPTPQQQAPRIPDRDIPEIPDDELPPVGEDDVVAPPDPSLPPVDDHGAQARSISSRRS